MSEEPMQTFRIRADALFRAHSLFHALGLLAAYFAAHRRPGTFNVNLLTQGTIEVLPAQGGRPVGPTTELRSLRLWHWRQALKASQAAEDGRTSRHSKLEHEKARTLHLLAVQALNDCFPLGDYAEGDEEREQRARRNPNAR